MVGERDYDRDGKTDLAVFTPATGAWTVLGSASTDGATGSYFLGRAGDIPVPADYDGDGWTDPAVWRPSDGKWLRLFIHRGGVATEQQWGANGDVPFPRSMHRAGATAARGNSARRTGARFSP